MLYLMASVDIGDPWLPVELNPTCSIAATRVSIIEVREGFDSQCLVPEQPGENLSVSLSSFCFKGGIDRGKNA